MVAALPEAEIQGIMDKYVAGLGKFYDGHLCADLRVAAERSFKCEGLFDTDPSTVWEDYSTSLSKQRVLKAAKFLLSGGRTSYTLPKDVPSW